MAIVFTVLAMAYFIGFAIVGEHESIKGKVTKEDTLAIEEQKHGGGTNYE